MAGSKTADRRQAFEAAASVLGLEDSGRESVSGVIDGFDIQAENMSSEGSSWFEVRVYVDGFPDGLEIEPWGWASRFLNLYSVMPFITAHRRVECADGRSMAVIAHTAEARDAWLTDENQRRVCALGSVLTHHGFLKGRHYLSYTNSRPATDTAPIVNDINKTLEDARQLTR